MKMAKGPALHKVLSKFKVRCISGHKCHWKFLGGGGHAKQKAFNGGTAHFEEILWIYPFKIVHSIYKQTCY